MIKEQKYPCTSELGAEILMLITSLFIVFSTVTFVDQVVIIRVRGSTLIKKGIMSSESLSLILSSIYALFLPLMSFMFSQAKQYYPEGRAQQILIWMVLIEFIRIRGDPIFTWELRKSAEQLVRLFWVGFLVYSYAPLHGIRVSLFILCITFAIFEVLKGIVFNKAKDSYLIGKNPKLIHNYVKRVVVEENLKTTPLNSCDYIVMGENYNEIEVCSNGYLLGKKKPNSNCNSEGMLTIGRVFELNSSEDEFTIRRDWRDTCLSFALAKMLRRRFANLPVGEAGCRKALDFVLEGLIDYIGNHRDIQTNHGNDGEIRNPSYPMERVFQIIRRELDFVNNFRNMLLPVYCYNFWYTMVDAIGLFIVFGNGVYLIIYTIKTSSNWLSLGEQEAYNHCYFHYFRRGSVVVKILSRLDLAITYLLVLACMFQITRIMPSQVSVPWSTIWFIQRYIIDPAKWKKYYRSVKTSNYKSGLPQAQGENENVKEPISISIISVFDEHAETLFCVKVYLSILARLPRWIRKKIPRLIPHVTYGFVAKEAVLRSLRNSGGRLTNGETSLKKYGMESLNWSCQPNGSTTEAILVWHIATTLFHQQEPSPTQQNNNPLTKEQEVALALSTYCHHLVAYYPELLPDEVEWTEEKYESVRKDILAIVQSFDHKTTKNDRCSYALNATWGDNSLVGKGVRLAKDLINCAEEGYQVWEMLAEFWPEMMLFIAPSDNVEGHQKILNKMIFITQLWALLTHAGIVTRPNAVTGEENV